MIISFMHGKGGVGKTTLTINIATAFKNAGRKILVVDADPQASLRDWHTKNGGNELDIIGLDRPTIDKDLFRFAKDYDYIFIDTPSTISAVTAKIITCSDVILVPVKPGPFDVWSLSIVDLIKQRQELDPKLKVAFIASMRVVKTRIGGRLIEVLKEYQLPILNHGTSHRIAYIESIEDGKTVLDLVTNSAWAVAKNEIELLAEEIYGAAHGA